MEYVIDVLKETLNEEEAGYYYRKSIVEMNEEERMPYMENEMKYLAFFRELFELNDQELIIRINFICSSDIEEFFDNEKDDFINEIKKVGIENIMLKKEVVIREFDDIVHFIKLSYRDFRAGFGKVELWYNNLDLKISSNSDYIYILETFNGVSEVLEEISGRNAVYMKKINTL
ncbi:hypothetical protein [Sebaldella sp. S0638]|uniref:hypothetical protein n=1 Tax=Sebaldella sp. S0638 TaxID=2957809 RepID=UPI00209CC3F5|nr:hypothetical protein [Sebaldella sp. S0638]MCP1223552.1 hypothetical protein [Sebaldella sp. S0638]